MTQRVFIQSSAGEPRMPCHPARARRLLREGRATVVRRTPFTLRLCQPDGGHVQPLRLGVDPGSRVSGLALVAHGSRRGWFAVFGGELTHRSGTIKKALDDRRAYRRRRRTANLRHRPARFDNRCRPAGWLTPSVQSRVDHLLTWGRRIQSVAPLSSITVETARFDVHALAAGKPLSGLEYQQGTLQGFEVREYLLHLHQHTCAYCAGDTGDPVLEVEHVYPKGRGGSDRVANLVIACWTCNRDKGNRTAGEWAESIRGRSKLAAGRRRRAEKIQDGQRPSLRDAAAMNAARYAVGDALKSMGLPVTFSSGGRTKANRSAAGHPKAHWIDAACVGPDGAAVQLDPATPILSIEARGRGRRQVVKTDRFGFPRGSAGRVKRVQGFQTGDPVRARVPKGKYAGHHVGYLAGVRADGRMDVQTRSGKFTTRAVHLQRLAPFDGYAYTHRVAA